MEEEGGVSRGDDRGGKEVEGGRDERRKWGSAFSSARFAGGVGGTATHDGSIRGRGKSPGDVGGVTYLSVLLDEFDVANTLSMPPEFEPQTLMLGVQTGEAQMGDNGPSPAPVMGGARAAHEGWVAQ